jgi:hypothetical protein
MIVSLLALFVALGGVSYAATSLPRNSVGPLQLRTGAVTNAKVATNAITSSKVLNRSLLAVDFKLGQIPKGETGAPGAPGAAGPPGLSGLQIVSGTGVTGTGSHTDTATCPTGKKAISGGFVTSDIDSDNTSILLDAVQDDGVSYKVTAKVSSGADTWKLTARVLCAVVAA